MARVFQLKTTHPSSLGIDYQAALNDEQRAVALAGNGPLLVLAGAGSGKTRALTYRVARLIDQGIAPEQILLLTFTNRAAKQMLERVSQLCGAAALRVQGGTFHHVANQILRVHATAIGYQDNFTIVDREDARDVMSAAIIEAGVQHDKVRFPKPDVLIDIASYAVNTGRPAREIVIERAPRFVQLSDDIMAVCRAFIRKKVALNLMDFDDLLMNWKILLEEGGALANHVASSYAAVLVDEYQDTNSLQGAIVDHMAKPHGNVTVVGDDAQCIYRFRGAEVRNMLEFEQRWPGTKRLTLQVNYRSTPQICDLANAALQRAKEGFKTRLLAVRPAGSLPALVPCRDPAVQAEFVAERILQIRDEGVPLSDIAVLYRAHRNVLELQVELSKRGIPFIVRSGLRFFEQAHIKDVLAHLKLFFNPDDELSFRRVVKLYEGIGNATGDALWHAFKHRLTRERDVVAAVRALPHDEALFGGVVGKRSKPGVDAFVKTVMTLAEPGVRGKAGEMIRMLLEGPYRDHLHKSYANGPDRVAEIEELADFAAGFADLEAFLSELALVQSFSAEEVVAAENPDEQITLSSVHQAKGLEWSRVFCVWCADGVLPSDLALKDPGGEEEERRLFYVAATRAKDEFYMVYPQVTRMRDTSLVLHRPSRFISDLPPPRVDADGDTIGLYEPWQLELVPADPVAALPAPAPQLETHADDSTDDDDDLARFDN
jgi:DNA helicase II / ATP-dependent DNA helicase PcrA